MVPPASASAISSGQKAPGTFVARLRAVNAPKTTITASSAKTSQIVSASKISLIT